MADACGPLHRGSGTDLALEISADLGKEVRKDEGRSAAFRTIDRQNRIVRKVDAGIVFGNAGVVPAGDLTQVDVCDHVTGEVEFLVHSRNVVDRNDSAENRRQSDHLDFGRRQLLIGHGDVAGTEIDRAFSDLPDTAARADGLVVDLDA